MNNILGIIADFNPIHKGHEELIKKAKESCNPDITVVIVSGPFSQRCDINILNKFDKAKYLTKLRS